MILSHFFFAMMHKAMLARKDKRSIHFSEEEASRVSNKRYGEILGHK